LAERVVEADVIQEAEKECTQKATQQGKGGEWHWGSSATAVGSLR